MRYRILSLAVLSLAAVSVSAWGQAPDFVNPNRVLPSEAATVKTPGTTGATDTPGALQEGRQDAPAHTLTPREIRALKKKARKSASSAPAAR